MLFGYDQKAFLKATTDKGLHRYFICLLYFYTYTWYIYVVYMMLWAFILIKKAFLKPIHSKDGLDWDLMYNKIVM